MAQRTLQITHLTGAVWLLVLAVACSGTSSPSIDGTPERSTKSADTTASVEIVESIRHEGAVWTEGLLHDAGVLWESTGAPTGSGVRALDPKTGDVLWAESNSEAFFAEGLVRAFGRTTFSAIETASCTRLTGTSRPRFSPSLNMTGKVGGSP